MSSLEKRLSEFVILQLMKETGFARESCLRAYRTASGDYDLAKSALCQQFEDNEKRLRWLRNEAKEAAYRREQAWYHAQVSRLTKKMNERQAAATLRARRLAFQIRVAIDDTFAPSADTLVEPVGKTVEGLCYE